MIPPNWLCEATEHYEYGQDDSTIPVMCTNDATQEIQLFESVFYVYLCDKHAGEYERDFWLDE